MSRSQIVSILKLCHPIEDGQVVVAKSLLASLAIDYLGVYIL